MKEKVRKMNSAVSDVETLNGMTRSLERSEVRRVGSKVLQARKDIARRIGITDDQIENFRSQRTKVVPNWLMARVRAELVSVLQLEAKNLEQEIQLHKQIAADHTGDALISAEAQLVAARQILRGEVTS